MLQKIFIPLYFCLCLLYTSTLQAQHLSSRCGSNGYTELLDLGLVNTTVKYAENINIFSQNQELFMNIFEPAGDTSSYRPAIILAFGGSFIAGHRNDLNELCSFFARHGYVAITIDYRLYNLLFGFDLVKYTETILGAMSDMKAAVRYLKADAARDNLYKVDTNAIFVGGYSAGAFTALNTGYLDESDLTTDLPDYVLAAYAALGSVEGNTGEASTFIHSGKVAGVLNLSGALLDSSFIDTGEPMLMSMHGVIDQTVPFGAGLALNFFPVHGSSSCHNRALEAGVKSYLYAVPGGDHTDIYSLLSFEQDRLNFYEETLHMMNDKICENFVVSSHHTKESNQIKIFPNPAENHLNIISDEQIEKVEIFNVTGDRISEHFVHNKTARMDIMSYPSGIYIAIIHRKNGAQLSQKLVINK